MIRIVIKRLKASFFNWDSHSSEVSHLFLMNNTAKDPSDVSNKFVEKYSFFSVLQHLCAPFLFSVIYKLIYYIHKTFNINYLVIVFFERIFICFPIFYSYTVYCSEIQKIFIHIYSSFFIFYSFVYSTIHRRKWVSIMIFILRFLNFYIIFSCSGNNWKK